MPKENGIFCSSREVVKENMKVALKNGQVVLTDDEDWDKVSGFDARVYNEAAKLHFGEFALLNEV